MKSFSLSLLTLTLFATTALPSYAQKGGGSKRLTSAASPFDQAANRSRDIVETSEHGVVNYTDQYIEAEGSSIIDTMRFKNRAQARLMARRGAVVDAQRNLLEIINGVEVQGTTTVENLSTTSDLVETRVKGLVKGARIVGQPVIEDGAITVKMRIPLYASNGLAGAVADQLPGTTPATPSNPTPVTPAANGDSSQRAMSQTSLPAGAAAINGDKPVAFRIQGGYDPKLFPVIVDEQGNVQLDMSKIYDPKKGQFPKIMETGKDLMNAVGFKKGVDVIDLIQNKATGQLTIASNSTNKKGVNWGKVGNTILKVGKVLLDIVL